ncbi:MAG: hypothetical protein KME23_14840 [Goleter apudmare HA4340-LM2]|jgi:hypothetical protein|nr:hypothetical protein [Goleter apudmare HA4340-LM2]
MLKLIPPSEISLELSLKKSLGCISKEPVNFGDAQIYINGDSLCYHDLYHLEVSCLKRIQMGKYQVSGIHGINSPIFHDSPIIEEYDGLLDEARVAFHEWLTRASFFNTIKLIGWIFWLITQRINPIQVLINHLQVLNRDISFIPRENKSWGIQVFKKIPDLTCE